MKLTVTNIGVVTKNDNRIITLKGEETTEDTIFGEKTRRPMYFVAAKADTVKVEVGTEMDINLEDWLISEHTSTTTDEHGHSHTNTQQWLHLK